MKKHDIDFLKSLGIIKKDCLIDYETIDDDDKEWKWEYIE